MCTTPFKVIFCIVNIWLLIIGLGVTIYGALLTWCKPYIDHGIQQMIKSLAHVISKEEVELSKHISQIVLDISGHYSIVIFAIGLVILLISLLGCIGVCCNASCCIVIYLIPLAILILAHIVLICVYFIRKDLPRAFLHKYLNQSVYDYKSMQSKTTASLFLGLLMPSLHCCGYNNGEDFQNSPNFQKTDVYDMEHFVDLKYPIPCCQLTKSFRLKRNGCPIEFNVYNSYIYKGCAKPLGDFIAHHLDKIVYLSLIILGTNILVFLLGIIAIKC